MKKILNTKYLILNTITRAYQSLKVWLDPATESHPYITDHINRNKFYKPNISYQFGRRRFGWNRFQ